jgi:signal transduction histidine kinase/ActR/RegA family two-component response regulator
VAKTSRAGPVRPWALTAGRSTLRWWLDRSVRAKGLTVVAIPMLALIAVGAAGLGLSSQERAERRIAIRANSQVQASRAVLADAVDAETGVRGYAGTGDRLFLQPYTAALARVGPDVQALRTLVITQEQKAQAETVATMVGQEFAQLDELRAAVDGGASAASLAPSLEAGKESMDRLRTQVADLADEGSRLLGQQIAAMNEVESRIVAVELSGLVLGVLAGLAGVALFTSGISRRIRVAADNANRLGHGQPLLAGPESADELGKLGGSLAQAQQLMAGRLAQLSAARDEAQEANRTKSGFLSRTSHELRTPLHAILGFAQLLEMSDLQQDERECTVRILGAGRHLLALINEVIDIARIEAGEIKLSVEPVRLHDLTQEIATLMIPLAKARGITIHHDGVEPTVAVYADTQRLRQVLLNLASNGVKYNRDGGTLRIAYEAVDHNQVALAVTDTGPGIPEEDIQRIFVPFERLQAEQHGIEGTGIGLPLALALTEAMHGSLDVTSTVGSGSTFAVRLPRAPDIQLDPAPPTDWLPATPLGRAALPAGHLVVLSIEDNEANSELLVRLFRSWPNTTLHAAKSALAGIDLAFLHHPDLILLDMHLPDLSGEEVFIRLKAEPATARIPIVVLSADASPGTIRRLLARGAAGYLTKPLDLQELGLVLSQAVSIARTTVPSEPVT